MLLNSLTKKSPIWPFGGGVIPLSGHCYAIFSLIALRRQPSSPHCRRACLIVDATSLRRFVCREVPFAAKS
jgi:hypothetical protein